MSDAKNDPPQKSNPPQKFAPQWRKRQRLDGRPRSLPRGRHAKPRTDDDDARREAVAVPIHQRLGFRVAEFAALTGMSYPTIWRRIKSGEIRTVEIGGVKLVPRAFAIECGLISENDTGTAA